MLPLPWWFITTDKILISIHSTAIIIWVIKIIRTAGAIFYKQNYLRCKPLQRVGVRGKVPRQNRLSSLRQSRLSSTQLKTKTLKEQSLKVYFYSYRVKNLAIFRLSVHTIPVVSANFVVYTALSSGCRYDKGAMESIGEGQKNAARKGGATAPFWPQGQSAYFFKQEHI